MNEDAEKLKALISDAGSEIDSAWVEELKEKYPFFALPEGIALGRGKLSLTAEQRDEVIARIALSLPGGEAARHLTDGDGGRFDGFYPDRVQPAAPSTNQAIDKFLATYGPGDPAETEILERLIFNPVADYSQQLAKQAGDSMPSSVPTGDSQDDRINRFILSVRAKENAAAGEEAVAVAGVAEPAKAPVAEKVATASVPRQAVKAPEAVADNSLLSESLAKIYIKTRRYDRAYEILSRLSLSFPEKNAYFADQLRFLRKLMLAESIRKKRIDSEKSIE